MADLTFDNTDCYDAMMQPFSKGQLPSRAHLVRLDIVSPSRSQNTKSPKLHFHVLLNEEVAEVELTLI
jgi:hypothetical protein